MNGSPSVRVALFIRESGSESPCRWFYVTGIYNWAKIYPQELFDFIDECAKKAEKEEQKEAKRKKKK